MDKNVNDIFEAMLLIIIMSIALGIGAMTLVSSEDNVSKTTSSLMYEDKNTNDIKGSKVAIRSTKAGTLNKYEVVLMTQIQDAMMPSPKSLGYNGYLLKINSLSRSAQYSYLQAMWQAIGANGDNTQFDVSYSKTYKQQYEYLVKDNGCIKLGTGETDEGDVNKIDKNVDNVETFDIKEVD